MEELYSRIKGGLSAKQLFHCGDSALVLSDSFRQSLNIFHHHHVDLFNFYDTFLIYLFVNSVLHADGIYLFCQVLAKLCFFLLSEEGK